MSELHAVMPDLVTMLLMGAFADPEQLVKILFVVVVIVGGILRALFSARKAVRRPPTTRGLREFLEEVRRESEEAQGQGARDVRDVQPDEAAEPAAVEYDVAAAQQEQARQEALRERRRELQQRRQAAQRQRQQRGRRPLEQPQEANAAEDARGDRQLSDELLVSKLQSRHIESVAERRHLESGLAKRRLRSSWNQRRATRERRRSRAAALAARSTPVYGHLTLRDLIVAQVIFSPPRSKRSFQAERDLGGRPMY